jgi:hypothetical protein
MTSTSQTIKAWSEAEQKFREDNADLLAEVESIKSRARAMALRFTKVIFTDPFDFAKSVAGFSLVDVQVDSWNAQTFQVQFKWPKGILYRTFPLEWLDISEEAQIEAYKARVRERAQAERDPMI